MPDFDAFTQKCVDLAKQAYCDSNMDGVTLFYAQGEGTQALWAIPMSEGSIRGIVYEMLAHCFEGREVKRYGVISRCWMSESPHESPENAPDRQEAVFVATIGRKRKDFKIYSVELDSDGGIKSMTQGTGEDIPSFFVGPILGLLDRNIYSSAHGIMAENMLSEFLVSGEEIPASLENSRTLLN